MSNSRVRKVVWRVKTTMIGKIRYGLGGAAVSLILTGAFYRINQIYPPEMDKVVYSLMAIFNGILGAVLAVLFSKLYGLAVVDPLTQVGNRRFFFTLGEKQLALAQRYERPLSIAMIDIDNFKAHNDAKGHVAGDKLLQRVATALQRNLRNSDVIARLGGDEFVLLLPNTTKEEAVQLIHRLNGPVSAYLSNFGVQMSVGVASFPEDGREIETLLNRADTKLYQTKAVPAPGVLRVVTN